MPLELVVANSPTTLKIVEVEEIRKNLSMPWRNSLYSIFICEQQNLGEESKYKDYVQNLPSAKSFPTNFNDDDKTMLQDSSFAIRKITERKASEATDYSTIAKHFPDIEKEITYDSFKSAKALANLRCFDMPFMDGNMRQVLIPFIEFAAVNFGAASNV